MKFSTRPKLFTLIELLIVISIIGVIISISFVSFSNIRQKGRDTKRIADIKLIQKSLEDYYRDEGAYPATLTPGQSLTGSSSSSTYMTILPSNPAPRNDGVCPNSEYAYEVTATSTSYKIDFCLSETTAQLSAGEKCATPQGILNRNCFLCGESIISYNSESYPTVQIGTQCWFKENLKTTKYNDNTNIPNLTVNIDWQNDTAGAYTWYNNDYATYGSIYGALYNFYTINGGKNLCPTGWHVPTDAEFKTLVEGQATIGCESSIGWQCSPAGNNLKEAGATHWDSSNTGTNSSGFTALGSGYRLTDGTFSNQGTQTFLWASSPNWSRDLFTNFSTVARYNNNAAVGYSVRCLKD